MKARLELLESVERDTEWTEILRLALSHAVAELGGLGGAVHLRRFPSTLELVATSGLSPADARPMPVPGRRSAREANRRRRRPYGRAAAYGSLAVASVTQQQRLDEMGRRAQGSRSSPS
ncbi:hypothetical protein [Streptomyces sp. yara]|uniref:hypothetical protein n=1 Tax=Streptomyces sp. yara TaxID=3458421 RepID=UPI00403FD062